MNQLFVSSAPGATGDSLSTEEPASDKAESEAQSVDGAESSQSPRGVDAPNELMARGRSLTHQFVCQGVIGDINKAIDCHRLALKGIPASENHTIKAECLGDLGNAYLLRVERLGELADINNAIDCYVQASSLTPDDHPSKAEWLNNLGMAYGYRFKSLHNLEDLHNAVNYSVKAVSLTPDGHEDQTARLYNLGSTYYDRFERIGHVKDINEAVNWLAVAAFLTPDQHADKPSRLNNLAGSYLRRFERLGDVAELDAAINCLEQALLLMPHDHADRPKRINNLGSLYRARFAHTSHLSDMQKAMELFGQVATLNPDGHIENPGRLVNLAVSYLDQFERLGEPSYVNKAIDLLKQAVSLTPDGHEARPGFLSRLAGAYCLRFRYQGNITDINEGINGHTLAVSLTPDDHSDKPMWLSELGISYTSRFIRTGELADIDEAIGCMRQALLLIPEAHVSRPACLNNLGLSYLSRFGRLRELADLNKAIECLGHAILLAHAGSVDQYVSLSSLGKAYHRRFDRLGNVADIHGAIHCHQLAASLAPDTHVGYPTILGGLGASYMTRFTHLNDVADLNESIKCMSQAVSLTPKDRVQRAERLNDIGLSYMHRYWGLSNVEDIDNSINFLSQAVSSLPDSHAYKPLCLVNLGNAYETRFQGLNATQDLHTAISCFQQAAEYNTGSPEKKFTSSCQWARLAFLHGVSNPKVAYRRVIELLPQLVWLGSTIEQRYKLITEIGNIATEAAACAIALGAHESALEWLEEGRSIVWNQILQLRTPFDQLYAVEPVLAERLKGVSRQLEHAGSRPSPISSALSPTQGPDLETEAKLHRDLASKWEQMLEQARLLPGFHDFMRPRKINTLKQAAKHGPVAVINVHKDRCDALILRPDSDEVAHVPLPNFSSRKAFDTRERLPLIGHRGLIFKAKNSGVATPELAWKQSLKTLWQDVVKPVFDFLGYTCIRPIEQLPHITWCTTGPLSFLPLHAASCYDSTQPNAFDLAVSSYTPTLGALLSSTPRISGPQSGLLAVGQEHTKGFTSLEYTVIELARIKEHAKKTRYLQLDSDKATVESVLNAMDEYSWVHLACHGTQDARNPSNSAFHLHDGSLMLSTITKKSFNNKGLAFLSACQTATGDRELPDEAVHLAAGMLMAGYPSVIATMWSISDIDGPEIAEQVYAELLKDGEMDCTRTARALHKAVSGLRGKVEQESFERWVPFIHIGL